MPGNKGLIKTVVTIPPAVLLSSWTHWNCIKMRGTDKQYFVMLTFKEKTGLSGREIFHLTSRYG